MLLSPPPPRSLLRHLYRRPLRHRISASQKDGFTESSGYLFDLSESSSETTEYSAVNIAALYRRRPLTVLRRVVQVGATLGQWFVWRYIDGLSEQSESMFEVRAAELRKILVQLGPAYIKIAQAISSRSDLVPPSYLDELSLLQDRISPFSTEVAFSMIERELGLPIEEIFSEISPEPVAAASLGQDLPSGKTIGSAKECEGLYYFDETSVYQARLRKSGKVVAVKVQRPGVQAAISLDILILRFIAGLIRRAGKFNTDFQAVVDEWASSLFRVITLNAGDGLPKRSKEWNQV